VDRTARSGAGGIVFLLTDYGDADEFAGVVRAVIARDAPGVAVIDLTHGIAPYDVRGGAAALERCAPHLGPGVVLGVVDPGVGGDRRSVALEVPGTLGTGPGRGPRHLVGPDNGLLLWAADWFGGVEAAVALASMDEAAAGSGVVTFDGRDRLAPTAARLAVGAPLADLGETVDPETLVRLADPVVRLSWRRLEAEVSWIDRFGNVQLAAGVPHAETAGLVGPLTIVVEGRSHPARRVLAFGELAPEEIGLLVDANRRLALCRRQGDAAAALGLGPGQTVALSP
jgi:S-adenosylmethionine hydrolase